MKCNLNIIFVVIITIVFQQGCVDKSKKEEQDPDLTLKNYEMGFNVWGPIEGTSFSIFIDKSLSDNDTLYIRKCFKQDSCKTKKIFLSKIEIDSVYSQIHNIIFNFKFNKRDEPVNDGTRMRFFIQSQKTIYSVNYSGVSQIAKTNFDAQKLIDFINNKSDNEFHVY